jgi:nucleoside-diphosphate-sugar epimerase
VKTALVTGAAGFTGRYLIPALRARQYQVTGLVEGAATSEGLLTCDLTDATATEDAVLTVRPDVVVHLAAISFVGHKDPEAFYRVNVFGTQHLLAALSKLKVGPHKVVLASSANVYGNPSIAVIDETVCPAPVNHYAISKLAMEHMARGWFDRLPTLLARPFNYTGPGQDERFVIPKIVNHFKRKEAVIELGNLDVSREFSDVNDVVAAYIALLESDSRSEVVNVCSGKSISLREVISMMSVLAGYEIDVRVIPELVRDHEIPKLAGSNDKLKRLIGSVPSTPFAETLKRMFEEGQNR